MKNNISITFYKILSLFILMFLFNAGMLLAQDHEHDHSHDHDHEHATGAQPVPAGQHQVNPQGNRAFNSVMPSQTATSHQQTTHDAHPAEGHAKEEGKLDVGSMILHHVTDANEFHVAGNLTIPLPCIVYNKHQGFDFFMSSVFHHGHQSHNGYVLDHGVLRYVDDPNFPKTGSVAVEVHDEKVHYNGQEYGASRSSFFDFSITKVVFTMLLAIVIMLTMFISTARAYKKRMVPKGLQSFLEPIVIFIRDEIAKPNLGHHYEKYLPYLLTVFFFIWISNMIGLIPFFPGSGNVMGNIAVTATLACFTFLLTNLSANKHYWKHIFNPPAPMGVNVIIIIIEFLSVFIKPFALMIRLFANITAGHIIILSLVSIIFIFAQFGGTAAGFGSSIIAGLFILFMNALELLVAALQAYIFTMLSAVFIGQAIEEPTHH